MRQEGLPDTLAFMVWIDEYGPDRPVPLVARGKAQYVAVLLPNPDFTFPYEAGVVGLCGFVRVGQDVFPDV